MGLTAADADASAYLRRTALRGFAPTDPSRDDPSPDDPLHDGEQADGEQADARSADKAGERAPWTLKLRIAPEDAPLPQLMKRALQLIGAKSHGPGEKIAWWVPFEYQGDACALALQKFGLRLYLESRLDEPDAQARAAEIVKRLAQATRRVEKLVLAQAPQLLARGSATVRNQHAILDAAYQYHRQRALTPDVIEDEVTVHRYPGGSTGTSHVWGKVRMQMHAFHDLIAALSAYLSRLEHHLVLSLAFADFDENIDNLTAMIGSRWGQKFDRILGGTTEAMQYRARLTDVVERWRNPYSHGGFEKGHGATIYLHVPDVGALPIALNDVRDSPLFSLMPVTETDIADVFAFFDVLDEWITEQIPHAVAWIRHGLDVRFDAEFRNEAGDAIDRDEFDHLIEKYEYLEERAMNMDY